jgi:hypothetical protein
MITEAQAGDVLAFGRGDRYNSLGGDGLLTTFIGQGRDVLTGLSANPENVTALGGERTNFNLVEIQRGYSDRYSRPISKYFNTLQWLALIRGIPASSTKPTFWVNSGVKALEGKYDDWVRNWTADGWAFATSAAGLRLGKLLGLLGGWKVSNALNALWVNYWDMEKDDVHFYIGPLYFNFKVGENGWTLEHYEQFNNGYRVPTPSGCSSSTDTNWTVVCP